MQCRHEVKLVFVVLVVECRSIDRSRYSAWAATVFDFFWLYTDVNRDGTVNILDVSIVGKAFGSEIGDQKYNRQVDMNSDNVVNIIDVAAIGKDLGKTMLRV